MIYFIQAEDGGPIKIGTTARLTVRLNELCKEVGDDLRVLAVIDGSYQEENKLHRRFVHLRRVGEWFEPGDDLLGFIVTNGREWDGSDDDPVAQVKVDAEVVRVARIVASYREATLAEYLSELIRPLVARDLEQEQAKEQAKASKPARPKRGGGQS